MVDEFDLSLHTLLADFILDLIHASTNAQLLFTSHNTNLIDVTRMRKDQILFVNKKDDGSSEVYSLYDFKEFRDNMDAEKGYKQGRMKPVFLVFCEGETEENYVDFIRRQYKSPIKIVPKTAGTNISQRLINKQQNELKISKDDRISTFLMYDLDVAPVVEKLKSCKAVWLCSNPCVELWFLLHSQPQTSELQTEQCVRALRKTNEIWQNYQKPILLLFTS